MSEINIPEIIIDIFRITTLGTFCSVFVIIIMFIMLYFDAIKQALLLTFIFMSLNGILTLTFLPFGLDVYGIGYFSASIISLIIGLILLNRYFKDLIYHTFNSQSVFQKREKKIET